MARVIVADDASGPEHLAALRADRRHRRLIAARAEQRLRRERQPRPARERPERDVVVLNSDIEALPRLAGVPAVRAPTATTDVGDRRRAAAVSRRAHPVRRHRAQPRRSPSGSTTATASSPHGWGPAEQASPALAVTGACMYVRREVIERVGLLDERYAMAYEDVDWCLRAWQAGFRVLYFPAAQLVPPRVGHARHRRGRARARVPAAASGSAGRSSSTRARCAAQRARRGRVGARRARRGARARGRAAPADRLRDRGHRRRRRAPRHLRAPQPPRRRAGTTCRCTRSASRPSGFRCACPCTASTTTTSWSHALARARRDQGRDLVDDRRARCGARASLRGIPVYFVQDIETSYYPDHERARHAVLDSYRPEFRYMTISSLEPRAAARAGSRRRADPAGDRPGDLPPARGRRAPRGHGARARSLQPAEEPAADARRLARAAERPRPELCLFGIEPELAGEHGHALRRVARRRAGQRAVLPGDRVRADLHPRGLRAAAAGGDGDGRRGRVHRRARQPRLLRGRRQLPDARARRRPRSAPRSRACSATPSCARGWGGPASRRRRLRVGAADRRAGGVLRGGWPHPAG